MTTGAMTTTAAVTAVTAAATNAAPARRQQRQRWRTHALIRRTVAGRLVSDLHL